MLTRDRNLPASRERLGLDKPCLYDSDEEIARQILDYRHPSMRGITLERLKERGWIRLNYPDPFVPFADGFPTASGKLEFLSGRMAKAGLDPLAGYTPPYETAQRDTPLAGQYPLTLIAAADHYFLNSLFANVADQVKRAGPPIIRIHPEDAAPRGLESGHEVRVFNDAARSSRASRSPIASAEGWRPAPRGDGPASRKEGATVNATVDERDTDMAAARSSTTTA